MSNTAEVWAIHRTKVDGRVDHIPHGNIAVTCCPSGKVPVSPWEPFAVSDGWVFWRCRVVDETTAAVAQ